MWAVIAPVWRDTKDVPMAAVEKVLQENKIDYRYNKSDLHFYLPNGSEIVGYSADKPDRIRGSNLSGAWLDELAAFQRANELWYEALMPAVRIGKRPLILVTTTPRPTPLIKELVDRDDGSVVVVRGSTFDNAANLSPAALDELRRRYEGTRIGRQELYGELLMDAEFALWNRDLIEAVQSTTPLPALMRTIVSVDPSGSADGDATGIVTAAVDRAGVIHILADDTCGGAPQHRYEQVCLAASRAGAGTIVYEAAYGGDNIAHGIKSAWESMANAGRVDQMVPLLKPSPTKQSKADRAHPVVALYEQTAAGMKRISHARPLPELEDEMVQWEPGCGWSPNRIDAMVHAVRFLAPQTRSSRISTSVGLPDLPSLPIG
jgi:phage terminase large subunit-like protein